MENVTAEIQADVDAISRIAIIPSLLEVICRTTGMGFAAVARVTETQWLACAVKDEINFGLKPGDELQVKTTICDEIRKTHAEVVIDHVETDEQFCTHPTPEMYGFQSYISMPIFRKNGRFFGTLCAIDPKPARLKNPETIGLFRHFAELISFHLEVVDELTRTTSSLREERKTAELREQFIAILGHDLRNPVGASLNSAQIIQEFSTDKTILRLAAVIRSSSYRVLGLIENMLDFARARMGEGIVLNITEDCDIAKEITQITTELQAVWPSRSIETKINLTKRVDCDAARISQLYSNLLSNALSYGKADEPVKVYLGNENGNLVLSVSNAGVPIPPDAMNRLFTAFSRRELKTGQQGLGLGLYIASEIAKAHHGSISVVSNDQSTTFTFRMPLQTMHQ